MSDFFDIAFDLIIDLEGGSKITNDKDDLGGLTKWGISQKSFPHLDIKNLTKKEAKNIYKKYYWDKVRGDEISHAKALCLFDCAVNQGVGIAIRLSQKIFCIKQDGKLGPITLSYLKKFDDEIFVQKFLAERALRYSKTQSFKKFGRGWLNRLFVISRKSQGVINATS